MHPAPSREPDWTASADPLGEALHFLRLSGMFYCRSELRAPWGLTMPAFANALWFHVITQGECTLEGKHIGALKLRTGDFVLVPHGDGHRLRSDRRAPTPNVVELPQRMLSSAYSLLEHGGHGAATTLVCGVVRFDEPAAHDLVAMLPAAIHLDGTGSSYADWMAGTLRLMADEARALRPGGETIITRLADVLVIQAIRSWLARDAGGAGGWIAALRDPQIGRAVLGIHREPDRAWTVGELAALAGMSRSSFAAHFNARVGEPPMAFVTRVRMRMAAALLGGQDAGLADLAGRLGYRSEAAFNRAFKRVIGTTPGAHRRSATR
ncbi:MAG: AraC family transcriptional regulator [Deltaproteobacteria bacterium]|nr:AraC family transcriptional regulator [Deltaproteobacteria bacterium]MBK8239164.1 AraC family transcriptional regulator [Deltaproteobacteria bacterium]MBK8717679.1 AraC family transcriptional regulator [Deltaproteobacteria bacterium]MBP7288622.1 AraC family transcriptional regulator [Nannocystaceae bacterium]